MKKIDLNIEQIKEALEMRDANASLGQIAKRFNTNKPSILKSLRLWDSGEQQLPDGRKYMIVRGQVHMLPETQPGIEISENSLEAVVEMDRELNERD